MLEVLMLSNNCHHLALCRNLEYQSRPDFATIVELLVVPSNAGHSTEEPELHGQPTVSHMLILVHTNETIIITLKDIMFKMKP